MTADRRTAFFWSLFAGGAFVVALLLPVHILLLHFGSTLGLLDADFLDRDVMTSWLGGIFVRIYVFLLVGGALFHAAHRFKHVLFDWGMTRSYRRAGTLLYGVAILGTAAAFLTVLLTAIIDLVWLIVSPILGG